MSDAANATKAEPQELPRLLSTWEKSNGLLVFLTGAGVSAESGIPTFRGKDGFWRAGSTNYAPQTLATQATFEREPETVWCWYISRFVACANARPNQAHEAIALIQAALDHRVVLITQNIDGLHGRAGSPVERTYAIHGDARFIRCSNGCTRALSPMPPIPVQSSQTHLSAEARDQLRCVRCGGWMRPHVLWFDEFYDEEYYRAESALTAATSATLLVTVGTTGATTLPIRIASGCSERGVPIVDINIEETQCSRIADRTGVSWRAPAAVALRRIAEVLGFGSEKVGR